MCVKILFIFIIVDKRKIFIRLNIILVEIGFNFFFLVLFLMEKCLVFLCLEI